MGIITDIHLVYVLYILHIYIPSATMSYISSLCIFIVRAPMYRHGPAGSSGRKAGAQAQSGTLHFIALYLIHICY